MAVHSSVDSMSSPSQHTCIYHPFPNTHTHTHIHTHTHTHTNIYMYSTTRHTYTFSCITQTLVHGVTSYVVCRSHGGLPGEQHLQIQHLLLIFLICCWTSSYPPSCQEYTQQLHSCTQNFFFLLPTC